MSKSREGMLYYSTEQAASKLGCTVQAVETMILNRKLQTVNVGGMRTILATSVEAMRERSGAVVRKRAVVDYLYRRRKELTRVSSQGERFEQEAAKKESAFIAEQMRIVLWESEWETRLDPAVMRAVHGGASTASVEAQPTASQDKPKGRRSRPAVVERFTAAPRQMRPRLAYVEECEKMDFGTLRRYIDDSLEALSESDPGEGPRSKEQFLVLLEMLRSKIPELGLPEVLPSPGPPPKFPEFEPSDHLLSLREEQGRLAAARASAEADPEATERSIRELKRRLILAVRERSALEDKELQEHAERREAYLRPYRKADEAYAASVRERDRKAKDAGKLMARRAEFAERIRRDIERAFGLGGRQRARRLPWQLLPPGELSAERLRRHYEGVQRRNPHIRYDPVRIEMAFSLGPKECYVGTDEFDGYAVFTFSHTEQVLLECPIFGNAVYIIDRDWKRLVRMSKRDLLNARPAEVTKIVHKGEWFAKVKLILGFR